MKEDIHPTFEKLASRTEKELILQQHSVCLWMTGLSGSGKTTIAAALEQQLLRSGYFIVVLDGDNIRSGINKDLGFSDADRQENIRRIAEIARLFVQNGVITICCFVSPTAQLRALANEIIGADMLEVFVDTPIEECEQRDVKGLYAKARAGKISDFTGVNAPFERPAKADITLSTTGRSVDETTQELLSRILPRIAMK